MREREREREGGKSPEKRSRRLACVRRLSRRQTRQEAADPAAPAWIRWRGGRIEAEEHEADEEVAEDGGRGAAGVVNGEN